MRLESPQKSSGALLAGVGGKTRAISTLAAYMAACIDHRAVLAPGERGTLPIMAASVLQAQQAFNFVTGAFDAVPSLAKLVTGRTADTLSLSSGVDIQVRPASYRTIRGITAITAIADEIAFWQSDNSVNPDKEILSALRPALATTGGPLIAISSPHARRGELYATCRKHFGETGHELILVAKAASRTMNSTLAQNIVDRAFEEDASAASAEYGAKFRTDVETFIAREVVDAAVVPGRHEIPPLESVQYVAFVDPSGGSSDSMTLAVAHREKDGRAVLDAIRERKPPFSPEAVVQDFVELLKSYKVRKVCGDRYAGEWPRERFRVHQIDYELSDNPKSDLYRDCLPLLNSGKVELLDNQKLITQLCSLERRTARGGRDSIDHPPGINSHDDTANSVCGALVKVAGRQQPLNITPEILARARLSARPQW